MSSSVIQPVVVIRVRDGVKFTSPSSLCEDCLRQIEEDFLDGVRHAVPGQDVDYPGFEMVLFDDPPPRWVEELKDIISHRLVVCANGHEFPPDDPH